MRNLLDRNYSSRVYFVDYWQVISQIGFEELERVNQGRFRTEGMRMCVALNRSLVCLSSFSDSCVLIVSFSTWKLHS